MDKVYRNVSTQIDIKDNIMNNENKENVANNIVKKTNFQKVSEFNRIVGHPVNTVLQNNILKEKPKLINLKMNLIREEMGELEEAVQCGDMVETRDALSDLLYVIYGFLNAIGADGDHDMGLVHESNMTKLCNSESEAIDTVNWYKEQYTNGNLKYDSPSYRFNEEVGKYIVYNESTGKILKNINYKPVNFRD